MVSHSSSRRTSSTAAAVLDTTETHPRRHNDEKFNDERCHDQEKPDTLERQVTEPQDDYHHCHDEENPPPPTKSEPSTQQDPYLVHFEDGDKDNPRNWPAPKKAAITFLLGMLAMSASLGSSIVAPAQEAMAEYVGTSSEVLVLSVSLYILGFALGPMLWAPISEIWGRRLSLLPPMFGLGIFSIGTAVSTNTASILVTRFFAGLFGSSPVSNVGAAMGDIFTPKARGTAIMFYAICVVGGPLFGPVIGAATVTNVGWRWNEYVEAIFVFVVFAVACVFLPELYEPVLLKKKAQKLRKETGDQQYYHPHENMKMDPTSIVTKHFTRPLRMLLTEPMVAAIALYASFIYALLYMTLQFFPIIFEDIRGWSPVVGSLPFLGMFVGVLCALPINAGNQPYYHRAVERNKGRAVPEARLPPVAVGSVLICVGIFWLGWTAEPNYHWILPVIAAAVIGAGFNTAFQQCINFLVDTYALYAASAVSANTILRSLMASGLPLAVQPMFRALGVGPAMSILGAVAGAAIPVPFLFMKYGLALRRKSKFAPEPGN